MVKSKGWNWKILKENEEEVWKNPIKVSNLTIY